MNIHYEQLEFLGLPPSSDPPRKRCPWCLTVKLAEEFSRDSSKRDGLARICRTCDSDRLKQRRLQNGDLMRVRERRRYSASPEQKRKAAAEYRRSDRGKSLNKLAVQRYRDRNGEKYAAHLEVRKAIDAGVLIKPEHCELAHLGNCSGRVEYHHDDYSKPLAVRPLCTAHHNAEHYKPRTYTDPSQPHDLFQSRPQLEHFA